MTDPTPVAAAAPVRRRGLMLALSSPSGAGKTTIGRALLAREPELAMSVSVTTRARRPAEIDGRDYHFIDRARFDQMVADGLLLEHAPVFGNFYGTPRAAVEAALQAGQDVLFDIEWQGVRQVAAIARADLVSVFILPPSYDELHRRLRSRGQDSPEVVAGRMAKAADEMRHYVEYDYIVINEDIDASVAKVAAILTAERQRRTRLVGLDAFASDLIRAG